VESGGILGRLEALDSYKIIYSAENSAGKTSRRISSATCQLSRRIAQIGLPGYQ